MRVCISLQYVNVFFHFMIMNDYDDDDDCRSLCGCYMRVGRECRVPSLLRRVTAEFIDFLLVFSVKLAVSLIAVDHGFEYVAQSVLSSYCCLLGTVLDSRLGLGQYHQ